MPFGFLKLLFLLVLIYTENYIFAYNILCMKLFAREAKDEQMQHN